MRILTLVAMLVISAVFASEEAWCQTIGWAEKAPPALINAIAKGQPQELIVLFDDTQVQNEAAFMRENIGADYETPEIITVKASRYKALKQRILSALSYGDYETLRDYGHLPLIFIRVRTLNGLERLLEHSGVVRVYEDEAYSHFLTESLPLINQPAVAAAGKVGTGTTVAVLDTGVDYTRAAFGSCTTPGAPSGCKVIYAQDFARTDGKLDDNGHGTNVAGIVLGVAPDTRIAALDVFRKNGYAYNSDIFAAIDWCIANKAAYNIVAMNLSLGGTTGYTSPCGSNAFASPIANARSAGILAAIASGNSAFTNKISSPACVPAAVSVGAVYDSSMGNMAWSICTDSTTYADKVTCFSNSASYLTILAPGALITAAGYTMAGTSQATPHIAGAIAVLRGEGAFPSDTVAQTVSRMTDTGVSVIDSRNGIDKPRIDLLAAVAGAPATYSISGTVTSGGLPLSGVTMSLNGGAPVTTNSSGFYSFSGLADGNTYTITPSKAGYTFLPASITLTITGADAPGQDFTATYTAGSFSIAGKVTAGGLPLSGVTMTLNGGVTVKTNYLGKYKFTGLSNGTYTVVPSKTGYTFTPVSRSVNINGVNVTGVNFRGQ